jgi:hypothetical protein
MKTIKMLFILLAASIILLQSCASVDTQSYVDPDFRNAKFQKICVLVDDQDLRNRDYIEGQFVEEFKEVGIMAEKAIRVMPPTREWTDENVHKFLVQNRFDGLLVIGVTGQDVEQIYNPGAIVTTTKGKETKKKGKTEYEETSTTKNTSTTSRKYHASFTANLFDVKTNKKAWVSTSTSEADETFSQNFDLIFDTYASNIVERLGEDGLVTIKNK